MAKSYSTFQDMAASDFSSISGTKSKPAKDTTATPRDTSSKGIMTKPRASVGGGGSDDSSSNKTSKSMSDLTSQLTIGKTGGSGEGFMSSISNYVNSFFDDEPDSDESIVTLDAEPEEDNFDSLYNELPPLEETLAFAKSVPLGFTSAVTLPAGITPGGPYPLANSVPLGFNNADVPTGAEVVSAISGDDVDAKASRTRRSTQEANQERQSFTNSFYMNIGEEAETDHGSVPMVSNDAQDKASGNITYDIGYGHKITSSEFSSGEIHGIPFMNEQGEYIPLTQEQKEQIMAADFEMHQQAARDSGWDRKLEDRGSSWEQLDTGYQNALTSLAYNVGGDKAGQQWSAVLDHAITGSRATDDAEERAAIVNFARELRRKDAGRNTAGMDNRVAKELYYAGLIDSLADVQTALPLANAAQAGIPATADYGSNPNRRPSGSQD